MDRSEAQTTIAEQKASAKNAQTSALDSAAVLAASSSYFFIGGILYLFRASPILTQSWHEDLPMNFMQMECHRPKGSSDFPVQERYYVLYVVISIPFAFFTEVHKMSTKYCHRKNNTTK